MAKQTAALMPREQAIVADLEAGMPVRAICRKHRVSPRTVVAVRKVLRLEPVPRERTYDLAQRVVEAIDEQLSTVAAAARAIGEMASDPEGTSLPALLALVAVNERLAESAVRLLSVIEPSGG